MNNHLDMSTESNDSIFHISASRDRTRRLREACEWLGVERGRATDYIRLSDEFEQSEIFSDERFLASFESYELVELFHLWESRSSRFPGIKQRIANVYTKGPILSDNENASASSNRARNNSFCYVVAGRFLAAGIEVLTVDGITRSGSAHQSKSDLMFKFNGDCYSVECKRLQSKNQLLRRANDARDQILASGFQGLIALDCSALFRPRGTVFQNSRSKNAVDVASSWLERTVEPKVRKSLDSDIVGFFLYSRIPTMTPIRIVDQFGGDINRRDCATSWLGVLNPRNSNRDVLGQVALMLERQASCNSAFQPQH